jgi:hypothetical protein
MTDEPEGRRIALSVLRAMNQDGTSAILNNHANVLDDHESRLQRLEQLASAPLYVIPARVPTDHELENRELRRELGAALKEIDSLKEELTASLSEVQMLRDVIEREGIQIID